MCLNVALVVVWRFAMIVGKIWPLDLRHLNIVVRAADGSKSSLHIHRTALTALFSVSSVEGYSRIYIP